MQDFLTFAIEALAISFGFIMVADLVTQLSVSISAIVTTQKSKNNTQPQETVSSIAQLQIVVPFFTTQIPDPWTLPVNKAFCSPVKPQLQKPLLLLPPAEFKFELTALKLYKLHGHQVVKVDDVDLPLPKEIKRYQLHKRDVIRLIDLMLAIGQNTQYAAVA